MWFCDLACLFILVWIVKMFSQSLPTIIRISILFDSNWVAALAIMFAPSLLLPFLQIYSFSKNASLSTNRRSIARRAGRVGKAWITVKVAVMVTSSGLYAATFHYWSNVQWRNATDDFLTKMYQFRAHLDAHTSVTEFQLKMECCGSTSYEDWFEIQQMEDEFLVVQRGVEKFDGRVISPIDDEVPWSCCKSGMGRRCRTGDLRNQERKLGRHHLTIHTDGCSQVVREVQLALVASMSLALTIFILCTAATVPCIRLYTTSKMRAVQFGGKVGDPSVGWIFKEQAQTGRN